MKNKLTNEEKMLQSKLEENSFEYNEANWSDLQNAMGKKGFLSSFSPFLKAAIGLVVLTASVMLVNTAYPDSETISPVIKKTVISKEATINNNEELKDHPVQTTSSEEKSSPIKAEVNPIKPATVIDYSNGTQKESEDETIVPSLTEGKNTNKIPQTTEETTLPIQDDIVTVRSIDILSPICMSNELVFRADVFQNFKEDLYYTWFVDNKEVQKSSLRLAHRFNESGDHTITLKVSYEENPLAEASRNIYIPPSPTLDFLATDLIDVFYDQNVNVKVLNPTTGEYRWLDEDKIVKFGKETVYTFLNEGAHQITLEHTSSEGCKTTVVKEVTMQKDFIEAFPNAFSTNGDGINEVFELKVLQIPNTHFELQIIDFSGNVVFKTQDAYEGWNGKVNNTGTDLKKGTFAWTAVITNSNNSKRIFNGKVKLNPGY